MDADSEGRKDAHAHQFFIMRLMFHALYGFDLMRILVRGNQFVNDCDQSHASEE